MRTFRYDLYNLYDKIGKEAIIKLFERYNQEVISGRTTELYKYSDLVFRNRTSKKIRKVEIETKTKFQKIIDIYPYLHILPRKLDNGADTIIYINSGITTQLLIIHKIYILAYQDHIRQMKCADHGDSYSEDFIVMPKELAKYYIIRDNGDLFEMPNFHDEELAKKTVEEFKLKYNL